MQLIGSLGAVAETMRNAATFAEQFAQMLGPLTFPGAPLMFPNGQMPQMPPPQAETTGKRKSRGEDDGEGKRKRKTKPKDPNAPKRPPSSYLLFQNEVRHELKAKHPNIPNNELLGKIAKAWSEMPKEEKDRYEERHTASKNLYLEQKKQYERTLTGDASTAEAVNPAVIAPAAAPTPLPAPSSDQEEDENEGGDDDEKDDSSSATSSDDEEEARPPPKKSKPDSKNGSKEKKRKSKA